MSTRASILIKQHGEIIKKGHKTELVNRQVWLYHHHDGYPDGLGKELFEWLKSFKCRQNLFFEHFVNILLKEGITITDENGKEELDDEFEWALNAHGDISYMYEIIMPSWRVMYNEKGNALVDEYLDKDIRLNIFRGSNLILSGLVEEIAVEDWKKL